MAKKPRVYEFKVALKGTKETWRRIAILGNQTLDDLHEAIYEAFDRYDEHLYSFYFPPPGSRGRGRLRDALEYTHPYNAEESGSMWGESANNAAKTKIASLGLQKKQRFEYLFDFGDEWWHELTVEEVDGEPDEGEYPRIVEKHGTSPPQYPEVDDEEDPD
jgi:hypothetical protein